MSATNAPTKHLVVLIHGINTRAIWMPRIEPTLTKAGFTVATSSYGKYGIWKFVLPLPWARARAVARVVRDVRTAIVLEKPDLVSVITHSFGTFIFCRILEDEPDLKWHRVIFCGSVVREDFPLFKYLSLFVPPLLNEVGTQDQWPAIAESLSSRYGSVGSHGFNHPPVYSRWHTDFGHSDFLTASFCEKFWVPFLADGTKVAGDEPTGISLKTRALTFVPLRWLATSLLIPVAFVSWLFFSELEWPWSGDVDPRNISPAERNMTTLEVAVMQYFLCVPRTAEFDRATRDALRKFWRKQDGRPRDRLSFDDVRIIKKIQEETNGPWCEVEQRR